MRYAIIQIEPDLAVDLEAMGNAFAEALETQHYQGEVFSFETPQALFSAISPKRWEMLSFLQGKPAMSIREIAKRLGRDVKNVHSDISKLLELGLLEKNQSEKIFSPFAEIKTEFTLKGIAA